MTNMIPVAVVAELIEGKMRSEAELVMHLVLHEAFALLTGHLHQAGLIDADQLAAQLVQAFSDPAALQVSQQTTELAEVLAGRILGAAHP